MSCFPSERPSQRELFRRWSESFRLRCWRRLHPRQAREYDRQQAEMWARIGPKLRASSATLFAPNQKLQSLYESGIYDTTPLDWFPDATNIPPRPPLTFRQRAVNQFWKFVEAVAASPPPRGE